MVVVGGLLFALSCGAWGLENFVTTIGSALLKNTILAKAISLHKFIRPKGFVFIPEGGVYADPNLENHSLRKPYSLEGVAGAGFA